MSGVKTNARDPARSARVILREDERALLEPILSKVLHDDDCFARLVSSERSESGRTADRSALARFLARMEGRL